MRWIPGSLGGRLLLGACVFVTVALIVAGLLIGLILERFVVGQVDQRLDSQIAVLASALALGPDGSLTLGTVVPEPDFQRPSSGWSWQAVGPRNALTSSHLPTPYALPEWPHGGLRDSTGRPAPYDAPDPSGLLLHWRIRTAAIGATPVTIAASAPWAAIRRPLWDALVPLGLSLLALGVTLLAALFAQIRFGLRPLGVLQQALGLVRSGRARAIPTQGQPSEVLPLVLELNDLIRENGERMERARRHASNLAHGLKTPLATLSLALSRPGAGSRDELLALTDQMDRLIQHHLRRARTAALDGQARRRSDLRESLEDMRGLMRKLHAERDPAIEIRMPDALAVACERNDLDEILGNLLDNACKWARHAVLVTAAASDRQALVTIDDDGPGLPDDSRHAVLAPGTRLDETVPGFGFGLPISRELVELYGGHLTLARSPLGGLRVAITLPPADPPT
ncbi:MAG: HAMP domain-containing sensor histidine kinase [Microvirga sp.]